jgi:signal transduction histidine kinase/transcriptional regulator with GAF, ATPase, and Fis domain
MTRSLKRTSGGRSEKSETVSKFIAAFREISGATVGALELNRELNSILDELTETLGFEFATVALVDEYRRIIETVRGKNLPLSPRDSFKYSLNSENIHAEIVRSGATKILREFDPKHEPLSHERLGFGDATRVFTPIVNGQNIVGVICAGCSKAEESKRITHKNISAVVNLGIDRGNKIAICRPFVLLEVIAKHAIGIIDADSASIHIYHNNEPLLEATAGRATREFLHRHPPSATGIGAIAMQTQKAQWIDDEEYLSSSHEGLYLEGIRAFAAFPLAFGREVRGILYVHFWKNHRITEEESELEGAFAQQMEVAIKNSLLMKDVADYAENAWTCLGLQKVINSLAARPNLPDVIDEVAKSALNLLGADSVNLYSYIESERRFLFPPVMAGAFVNFQLMKTQIEPGDIIWKIVDQEESLFISDAQNEPMITGPRVDGLTQARFVQREKILSLAALVLKGGPENEIVGLMFVNYRHQREFSEGDRRVMSALGASAALAIQTVRLHHQVQQDLNRRNIELEALREIDKKICSTPAPNLLELRELILQKAVEVMDAAQGSIWNVDTTKEKLFLEAIWPPGSAPTYDVLSFKDQPVGTAARNGRFMLNGGNNELAFPFNEIEGSRYVLNITFKNGKAFHEKDRILLETFAVLATTAGHIVRDYRELNQQIQSFKSLCLIEARIQNAENDLETLLQMLATGITAQQGLGFSRAMVFLVEDTSGTMLRGITAVGGSVKQEAESIWSLLEQQAKHILNSGKEETDVLDQLLKEAETHATSVRNKIIQRIPLAEAVRNISLSLKDDIGVIRKTLQEGRVQIVAHGEPDFLRSLEPFRETKAYICVPLIGKNKKQIGIVVVDNRFLPSERSIDRAKIHSLEAFAGVAVMSIENARLREAYKSEAIQAQDRAKAFREVLVETAHEFRSPLQNLLGRLVKLERDIRMVPSARNHLSGIENEIYRAKKVMADSLAFGASIDYNFGLSSLRSVLEDVVREFENRAEERNIRIILWDNAKNLPEIEMDAQRIRQVLTNVLDNAIKYSFNARSIHIRGHDSASEVRIQVQDKGIGIPLEQQRQIFKEFTRQVVVDPKRFIPGTGIGLKVANDIALAHAGCIEVSSIPFLDDPTKQGPEFGHTVTFTIVLPKKRKK